MKLSSKGRYAVMAMADLAKNYVQEPTSLVEISVKFVGCLALILAKSAIAITAYLPLFVSFILNNPLIIGFI